MNIRLEKHDDGIAHVIFDNEGSAANIFDRQTGLELSAHLDTLAADTTLKGVVFLSAKDSIFVAGADIKSFLTQQGSQEDLQRMVADGQAMFNRIAALKVPTIAAIHGACLGGGLEMCLACDWRIASDDRSTKIGLPETSLGIVPGWGGCARLPRLIGLPKALDMILQGKRLAPRQALKYGVIDRIVPREHFERWARTKVAKGKPTRKTHWFTNNPVMAKIIAGKVRPTLVKKTRNHYPAVFRALDITTRGVSLSIDQTLTLEREALVELIQGDVSNNLVRVFFMQERAKHLRMKNISIVNGADTDVSNLPGVNNVTVVGAGTMGAGIAQWCSARGRNVVLKDIGLDALTKGMSAIGKVYHSATKRRIFTRTEARQGMDRINPTTRDVPLHNMDMVIEAATENMDVKKKIFAGLEAQAGEHTILATNTSALSISELAASTNRPDRVIGIHFFNPVHRMQLVEIVVGEQTSPETTARTLKFVQKLGKMPVVTRDSPGFAVNRILMPYLTEAGHLFASGASIKDIDACMLDYGMPMGPLRLIDEVGIDVADHVASFFGTAFGDRMPAPDSLPRMVEAGLLGRKSKRGFYVYDGKGEPPTNGELSSYVNASRHSDLSRDQLQERMVLVMLNEAARCMEENVVSAPEDVDFAMIMGTGFAPFRGGPLRCIDSLGAEKVVESLDKLAENEGIRFAPCELLRSMARDNQSFYSD